MLCIPDSTTNDWIAYQMGYSSSSWIGYSDLSNNDRNYEWVSGCSSSYSNYESNWPNYDCIYGDWHSTGDYGSSWIACSCEYSIAPTSLPTLSLPTPLWPKPPTEMTVVKLSYINLS